MSYGIENISKKLDLSRRYSLNILFITSILILVAFIYSFVNDRNKQLANIKIQEIQTVADSVKSALHGVSDSYFLCLDRNWIGAPVKAINVNDQSIDDWGTEVFKINRKVKPKTQDQNNLCTAVYKTADRPLEIDRPIQVSPGTTLSRTGIIRMASYQDNYYFAICFGLYIDEDSHQCDDINIDQNSVLLSQEYQNKISYLYNNLALKIHIEGKQKSILQNLDRQTSGKLEPLKNTATRKDSFNIHGQWMKTSQGLLIYEIGLSKITATGKMLQQIRFVSSEYKHSEKESIHKMEARSIYKIQSSPITLNNKLFFSEKLISLIPTLRNQYAVELKNVSENSENIIAELYPHSPLVEKQEHNKVNNHLLSKISGMNRTLKEECQKNKYCSIVPKTGYERIDTHSEFLIKYSKPVFSANHKNKIGKINVILDPDQFMTETQHLSNFLTLISFVAVCTFLFILGVLNFRKFKLLSQELKTIKRQIFHDIKPYRNDVLKYLKDHDETSHDKTDFCFKLIELHHDGITEKVAKSCKEAQKQNAVGGFRLSKAIDFVKNRMKERHGDIIDTNIQEDSDVLVWGDKMHFVFILENIVKNAKQHRYKDTRIKITLSTDGKDPVGAIVTVFNQGDAIPDRYKNKIFKLGYKKNSKGSGMGLYFVSKAIDGFGGHVNCHNAVDLSGASGVTFTLFLPNDCLDMISSEINLEELS